MKKINKKLLGVGLIVLFFSVSLIFLVKAQVPELDPNYFRVNSASTTPSDAKRAGDEKFIHVINRSSRDYFVPNKTTEEFNSFRDNAPRYVGVAVCGDGVCSEGESYINCPDDCAGINGVIVSGALPEGCGDGVCKQEIIRVTLDPPVAQPTSNRVCDSDQPAFIAVSVWNTILATITGCAIGGPIGCFVGAT